MTFNFRYGDSVVVLPKSIISSLDRATAKDIKILILLSAYQHLPYEQIKSVLFSEHSITEKELDFAMSFWRGAGAVSQDEIAPEASVTVVKEVEPKKKILQDDTLPYYTGEEIQKICDGTPDMRVLIDSSQQILGKMFTHTEASNMIALSHYLGLDVEYILILCAYCKKIDKTGVKYIVKTACGLFNNDITTPAELNVYIKNQEKFKSMEYQFRRLFGMGDRSITKKEREYIDAWTVKFNFPFQIIEKAYEITIDAGVKKSPMNYMNKILENWYSSGVKTLEDIENLNKKHTSEHKSSSPSFDIDDFFAAAVARGQEKLKKD